MTYKPTEYDLNWTRTLFRELKIGGVWGAPGPMYVVIRTGDTSVKIEHAHIGEGLHRLILNIEAIGWTYELDNFSKATKDEFDKVH